MTLAIKLTILCFMYHVRSIFLGLLFSFLAISALQADSSNTNSAPPSSNSRTQELTPLEIFSITLKPQLQSSPLPLWIDHPLNFSPESSSLEISLAPLAQQTAIDHFVLSVVFDDHGDGGPFIEWQKPNGNRSVLCSGLGVNGPALGFNSRKLLIPYDLAFEGGRVIIHHEGRFQQLISATIQVAHTATVASLTSEYEATLLDEVGNITSRETLAGELPPAKEGDTMKGRLLTAELSATTQQGTSFEFPFNLEGSLPDTTMLTTEIIGLDLESQIEVRVNDTVIGMLNTAPFSLTASELINTAGWESPEHQPSFHFAGWRKAWLYIPGRVWKKGEENHILLTVPSSDSPISLKNTTLDLYYSNLSLGYSTSPLAKDLFRY